MPVTHTSPPMIEYAGDTHLASYIAILLSLRVQFSETACPTASQSYL
jgi:hypothetical protein